jgi:DNA-binding winged helix-turn-helix (wHTH) protein
MSIAAVQLSAPLPSHTGSPASRSFAFGEFVLRPERQLLLNRGVPVRIGGRALDLLTALVERPGELVDKQVLVSCAWPRTFVDGANLKVNMGNLRRVLGECRATPRYIATVVGRGYRFIAPVRASEFEAIRPVDCEPATAARIAALVDAVEAIQQELRQISAGSHRPSPEGFVSISGMPASR